MFSSLFFLVLAFSGLPLRAQVPDVAPLSEYPAEVRATLARHPEWVTFVYSTLKLPVGENWVVLTTKQPKKWKVQTQGSLAVSLEEVTDLTIDIDSTSGKLAWKSGRVDLTKAVDTSAFYMEGLFEKETGFSFRFLSEDRFEATNKGKDTRVIFVPSFSSHSYAIPVKFGGLNVWTAPLGPAKESSAALLGLTRAESGYLHHRLSGTVRVVADASYPIEHLAALGAALSEWNVALGVKLFKLEKSPSFLDVAECLSTRKLCVNWKGPADIPWTGISGSAISSYDPQSGLIWGGVITFSNSAETPLKEAPAEINQTFLDGGFDRTWIAQIYLRKQEFASYRHPMPKLAIQAILEHEIGHYNGFSHNFAGSIRGTETEPSGSIMDYFPFPGIRHLTFGRYDREVIRAVYRGISPSADVQICSDFEKDGLEGIQPKIARCNAFDFGEPISWYQLLANSSPSGVFTKIDDAHDVLFYLGAFLAKSSGGTPQEVSQVSQYLCQRGGELPQIVQEVERVWKTMLTCP